MTLYLIIAAGVLAVLYGIVTRASLLKASTGNERMNEIAGAIQEGAKAYLNKQYKTCLLYTSPSPRDKRQSRMPSSA